MPGNLDRRLRDKVRNSEGTAGAVSRRVNGHRLGRAGRLLELDRRRLIVPDLHAPRRISNGDRRGSLFLKGGAQMLAVDLRDGAGTAEVDRHLVVAPLDPTTEDVPGFVDAAVRARSQPFVHLTGRSAGTQIEREVDLRSGAQLALRMIARTWPWISTSEG